jgi:anti-sigma B factor antagonist
MPSASQHYGGFRADLIRQHNGVMLVVLAGELDVATAPVLQRRMDALAEEGQTRIVIDCSYLSYIDSSGVAILADTWERLTALGGSLVVRNPSPMAVKLFQITKVASMLLGSDEAA